MSVKIDNIELDNDNVEFNNAAEFVRITDKLVYLTGKAGTGKTTFLKYIKETSDKNIVILAPTGVAAINAGGVTIHSFFQIPLGPFVPDDSRLSTYSSGTESIYTTFNYNSDKRKIIENLELLIIDEISMVRADLLDVIDRILKVFRKKIHLPFGGVQVILIGDTFQLPPIVDNEQWAILSQFYKTPFFFSSKIIEKYPPMYIELKKIYRQNEQEFIDLLNRVRINQLSPNDFRILNLKYNPTFSGNGSDYIILATHNKIVEETNLIRLNQLESEHYTFEAKVIGAFPEKNKPTDHYLKLKVNAQIMFIKNDTGSCKRYFNGKIGKIKELEEKSITIVFDNGSEVKIEKAVWNYIQYTYNKEKKKIEEEIEGTFEQFPIRLAWAITVHKSQGLTFEKVIADLGRAFDAGQVYVALSRCTSFNGLVLKSELTPQAIITNPKVIEFAKNETPGTLVIEQLTTGKADFYYKKAREEFSKVNLKSAIECFRKAIKFRNDIETDGFERYIIIQVLNLLRSKSNLKNQQAKLFTNCNELEEAFGKLSAQNEAIEALRQKNSKLKESIKLLQNKSEDAELQIDKLKDEKGKFSKDLATYKNRIERLDLLIRKVSDELQNEKRINKSHTQEIHRLRDLKWYDKLVGKQ